MKRLSFIAIALAALACLACAEEAEVAKDDVEVDTPSVKLQPWELPDEMPERREITIRFSQASFVTLRTTIDTCNDTSFGVQCFGYLSAAVARVLSMQDPSVTTVNDCVPFGEMAATENVTTSDGLGWYATVTFNDTTVSCDDQAPRLGNTLASDFTTAVGDRLDAYNFTFYRTVTFTPAPLQGTTSGTPTQQSSSGSDINAGAIAGGVAGGVVFLLIVCCLCLCPIACPIIVCLIALLAILIAIPVIVIILVVFIIVAVLVVGAIALIAGGLVLGVGFILRKTVYKKRLAAAAAERELMEDAGQPQFDAGGDDDL